MTLTNHLLTGAALAKFLPLPIAVPLAFASHIVLDAVPHFGFKSVQEARQQRYSWLAGNILDVIVAVAIAVWLVNRGDYKLLLVGLIAYSPDFVWIYRFIFKEKLGKLLPAENRNPFNRLHANIQKYERPWAGLIELVYAVGLLTVLR